MKKIFRNFLLLLLVATFFGGVVSCAKPSTQEESSTVQKCTVSYVNTDLKSQSVEKGTSIQKPTNPQKSGSVFVGWYSDAEYTNKVTFPLTIEADTNLYAKFYTYQEAFQKARDNTIGDNIGGFEYSYTMDISASCLGIVGVTGKNSGNAKYSNIGEVNYYDESVSSGALLYDGSSYKIRRGTTLQSISLDENGKIKKCLIGQVDGNYKYDSSSLAKVVFSYSDNQIKSISPTNQSNVYKLNTSESFSSVVSIIANCLNHPIIEKLLCELPETAAATNLYVSFNDDMIDSYTYEFKVAVSELQFDLKYTLKFTDVGTAKNIVAKDFENLAISSSDIKVVKDEVLAIVNSFRNQEKSGYDFNVETGVDFGASEGEINSKFSGSAYRKIQSSSVFFHNAIEIDSDFKNKDLYKDKEIDDVNVKLTKLSNGEVHIIEKKVLTDKTQKLDNFADSDTTSFYLFDALTNSGEYSFAEKSVVEGKTVYTFGLTNAGAATLLNWLNGSLDLDPLDKAAAEALVYGKFNQSSVLVNSGVVSVVVNGGALESINVSLEGDFTTAFEGSAEFAKESKAQIKLDMSVVVKANGNLFEPFDTVNDAK